MTDNSWYERGDLPPVGCECEVYHGGKWKQCTIMARAVDRTKPCDDVIYQIDRGAGWGFDSLIENFRPLKSDRDKKIDAAAEIIRICEECHYSAERTARDLYEAGLLRLPEQK